MTHKNEMISRTKGCIGYYEDFYKSTCDKKFVDVIKKLNDYLIELETPVVKKKSNKKTISWHLIITRYTIPTWNLLHSKQSRWVIGSPSVNSSPVDATCPMVAVHG